MAWFSGQPKVRDDTAISTGGCEYQFGIYAAAACSPSYIKCAFGAPAEHPCDVGTVYDERIHACNWPDQVIGRLLRQSQFMCRSAKDRSINCRFRTCATPPTCSAASSARTPTI